MTPTKGFPDIMQYRPAPDETILNHDRLIPARGSVPLVNQRGKIQDPRQPIFVWHQDTPAGPELNIALYTRPCRWGRCSFCTLPSQSASGSVQEEDILAQIDYAIQTLTFEQRAGIRRVFLSNNGSVLDEVTLPFRCLLDGILQIGDAFPELQTICLETRFETVTRGKIQDLLSTLRKLDTQVRLQFSGGYETQDPYLRNRVLFKGYSEDAVHWFFNIVAEAGPSVLLDEYVLLRPAAGMTEEEGIREAVATICHLDTLSRYYGVEVSVRLNPAFAAVGSELHQQSLQGLWAPPTLQSVSQVIIQVRQRGVRLPIFVGLNHEGLTDDPATCLGAEESACRQRLQQFNQDQDWTKL